MKTRITTSFSILGLSMAVYATPQPDYFEQQHIDATMNKEGSNKNWSVPEGADNYSGGEYERPSSQTYKKKNGIFVTDGDYFANLDIACAHMGQDDQYIYVKIQMVGDYEYSGGDKKKEGLNYEYRFQVNVNDDGKKGYLFRVDQPASNGTRFQTEKNFGYYDSNGDAHKDGNGYEKELISDGKKSGSKVLYSRINPDQSNVVEFALDYNRLGINPEQITTLTVEANKGLKDVANYPWNKEYNFSEAGTPYSSAGLGNIYELDTLVVKAPFTGKAETAAPEGKLTCDKTKILTGDSVNVSWNITTEESTSN